MKNKVILAPSIALSTICPLNFIVLGSRDRTERESYIGIFASQMQDGRVERSVKNLKRIEKKKKGAVLMDGPFL